MTEQTTRTLEQRVAEIEDRLAIYQVIAAYGPAVDSLNLEANDALWTDDCEYELDSGTRVGHAGLRDLLQTPFHQGVVTQGCAHVSSLPYVHLDGEDAYATNYHQLITHTDGQFKILRLTACRWHLQRIGGAWKIRKRTNMLLDGTESARRILRRAGTDP